MNKAYSTKAYQLSCGTSGTFVGFNPKLQLNQEKHNDNYTANKAEAVNNWIDR